MALFIGVGRLDSNSPRQYCDDHCDYSHSSTPERSRPIATARAMS